MAENKTISVSEAGEKISSEKIEKAYNTCGDIEDILYRIASHIQRGDNSKALKDVSQAISLIDWLGGYISSLGEGAKQ